MNKKLQNGNVIGLLLILVLILVITLTAVSIFIVMKERVESRLLIISDNAYSRIEEVVFEIINIKAEKTYYTNEGLSDIKIKTKNINCENEKLKKCNLFWVTNELKAPASLNLIVDQNKDKWKFYFYFTAQTGIFNIYNVEETFLQILEDKSEYNYKKLEVYSGSLDDVRQDVGKKDCFNSINKCVNVIYIETKESGNSY